MGFMDDMKDGAKKLADKAEDLAAENHDKVKQGLDKAEDLANKATKNKYADKIASAGDKADAKLDDLHAKRAEHPPVEPTPATPPVTPPVTPPAP